MHFWSAHTSGPNSSNVCFGRRQHASVAFDAQFENCVLPKNVMPKEVLVGGFGRRFIGRNDVNGPNLRLQKGPFFAVLVRRTKNVNKVIVCHPINSATCGPTKKNYPLYTCKMSAQMLYSESLNRTSKICRHLCK